MLSDNPIFSGWYTDTVDIYRVVSVTKGNIETQERKKINESPIPCRIYQAPKDGPSMGPTAAKNRGTDKMACDLSVDTRAGDELMIVRGGNLGHSNSPERYFAGDPMYYYDPVGGALTGLEHKEIGLLKDNIVE